MIVLDKIRAGYPEKTVFESLTLALPQMGALAVLGPSGSGKTTLLRLLAGLIQPYAGEIRGLAGKRVSMMFQEDRLLPWRTAYENVLFALPGDMRNREEAARRWLSHMELGDVLDAYPAALSGGMKRRVALARACAYESDLLLLDEPFKGLDEALRERIARSVTNAAPIIVLLTHDPVEAELMGAQIEKITIRA